MAESCFLAKIFNTDKTKNKPTPTPMDRISVHFPITPLSCPANTDKSGSAMVINRPMAKQTPSNSLTLPERVSAEPACSPMGVMAISAPKLNRPIPKISKTEQIENTVSSVALSSIQPISRSRRTMADTGKTDRSASFIFMYNACFKGPLRKQK